MCFYQLPWAMNLSRFLGLFSCIICIWTLWNAKMTEIIVKSYRNNEHLPLWLDLTCYWGLILIFAAFAHWGLTIAWIITASCDVYFRELAKKQT